MSISSCRPVSSGRQRSAAWLFFVLVFLLLPFAYAQDTDSVWRPATNVELRAFLPARATVVKEHIETEMRAASGVTDGHGKFIAGVVLITAGYSADGKYSHYLIAQAPLEVGGLSLPAGHYVFGWERGDDLLKVHFYDAATGTPRGTVEAKRLAGSARVESFRIWPPQTKSLIQIGRFGMPYQIRR